MTFDTHGFFSPGMERFRTSVRTVSEYKGWLEFAEGLNRLGLDMLEGLEIPLRNNQRLTIAALFVRAHKSFQAAIILAEIGLLGDARTVLRSAVEGAIALNALANDATFVERLINAHYHWQRKAARLLLGNPDYRATYSPEEIAAMEATVREVDAREATGSEIRDITWGDVAAKHCKDLYNTLYRLLSSDGTHTTINSIHRAAVYDAIGQIAGFKVGPDEAAAFRETLGGSNGRRRI